MPKLSSMIGSLSIDGKNFKNPEWWATKHKINREIKKEARRTEMLNSIKANAQFSVSYVKTSLAPLSADEYIRSMKTQLDNPKFSEFAPWNPMFRNSKNIITFKP